MALKFEIIFDKEHKNKISVRSKYSLFRTIHLRRYLDHLGINTQRNQIINVLVLGENFSLPELVVEESEDDGK